MERETRFELATSCLEGRRSTTELLPLEEGRGVGGAGGATSGVLYQFDPHGPSRVVDCGGGGGQV